MEVDADTDLENFQDTRCVISEAKEYAAVIIWGWIMNISLAMRSATMGHIQGNRVGAMQDGLENVVTTVRTFLELLLKDLLILPLYTRY